MATATATESPTALFEQTSENIGKALESMLEMQREMFSQAAKMMPGLAQPQGDWTQRIQRFQKDWAGTATDLMRKNREIWDQQYRAGIESLEEAFRVPSSKDPLELRDHLELFFRKSMDLVKATSEMQMRQFQEAVQKWAELFQTKP
jgi:hypothetical protein